uniref:Ceramide synthase 4 n=1 Tax=Sphenodon punctatus TaxID=8508 RepID=A0A8D0L8S0_SPHPU
MLSSSHWLLALFWNHKYWLPPGVTWEDMAELEGAHYPMAQHLLLSIPCAMLLVVIRYFFERLIALPLSQVLGVRDKVRLKAPLNPILEAYYAAHSKCPKEGQLISLAKQCDLPSKRVERWFRCRRNQERPGLTKKFAEACWRFTFYFTSFFSGLAILYPPLQPSLSWYYMLELAFYCSLVLTLPFDVKRKDFTEQIVHHVATLLLIFVSYCTNLLRFGMIVMVIHDASDYILEMAKMLHYAQWKRTCEILFVVFALVFMFSRLVRAPPFFVYYFLNTFLMVLQLLHIFWSFMILRMIYNIKEKDDRSDTDETDDNSEEERELTRKKEKRIRYSNGTKAR